MILRWLLVLALAACVTDPPSYGAEGTSRVQRFVLPIYQAPMVDLLFVIDNSPAMAPHRERLRANFAQFINVLNTIQGGLPSLHIGVVTTDVGGCGNGDGDAGRLRTNPLVDGAFISDLRYQSPRRFRNYTGELSEVFSALADVGSDGCVYARPLDAVRRALEHPANAGFARDDAYLAVILITATDDCSFTPAFSPTATTNPAVAAAHCFTYREDLVDVNAAAHVLRARHADPSRTAVALIGGPDTFPALRFGNDALEVGPSCSDEAGGATAAPRLHAFVDQFPGRSTTTTLCQQNLSDALVLFAGPFRPIIGDPCFAAPPLDLAPELDGIQADCSAAFQYADGTQRQIPSCGWGTGLDASQREDCWSIQRDERNCPAPFSTGLVLHVTPLDEPIPRGTFVVAECVSE